MKEVRQERPERRGTAGAWLVVLAICAAVIAWGVVNWLLVRDGARAWDFGVLRDAPGESPDSTEVLGPSMTRQIAPLPEAETNAAPAALPRPDRPSP